MSHPLIETMSHPLIETIFSSLDSVERCTHCGSLVECCECSSYLDEYIYDDLYYDLYDTFEQPAILNKVTFNNHVVELYDNEDSPFCEECGRSHELCDCKK